MALARVALKLRLICALRPLSRVTQRRGGRQLYRPLLDVDLTGCSSTWHGLRGCAATVHIHPPVCAAHRLAEAVLEIDSAAGRRSLPCGPRFARDGAMLGLRRLEA